MEKEMGPMKNNKRGFRAVKNAPFLSPRLFSSAMRDIHNWGTMV